MRHLALLVLFAPAAALAQPGTDGAPPPPPAGGPVAPPDPTLGAPPVGYGPPLQPQAPQDRFALHRGVTFEANLGIGFVHASVSGQSNSSDAALAGLDIGVGGWLTPQLALTGRVSDVDIKSSNSSSSSSGTVVAAFVGPSLQYWIDPHIWIGGGAGLGTLRAISSCSGTCSFNGFGLDFRAGYSFGDTQHTFNISVEVTPGFYNIGVDTGTGTTPSISVTETGIAFLAGYQFL